MHAVCNSPLYMFYIPGVGVVFGVRLPAVFLLPAFLLFLENTSSSLSSSSTAKLSKKVIYIYKIYSNTLLQKEIVSTVVAY